MRKLSLLARAGIKAAGCLLLVTACLSLSARAQTVNFWGPDPSQQVVKYSYTVENKDGRQVEVEVRIEEFPHLVKIFVGGAEVSKEDHDYYLSKIYVPSLTTYFSYIDLKGVFAISKVFSYAIGDATLGIRPNSP